MVATYMELEEFYHKKNVLVYKIARAFINGLVSYKQNLNALFEF